MIHGKMPSFLKIITFSKKTKKTYKKKKFFLCQGNISIKKISNIIIKYPSLEDLLNKMWNHLRMIPLCYLEMVQIIYTNKKQKLNLSMINAKM